MWRIIMAIPILLLTSGATYPITLSEYQDKIRDTIRELEPLFRLDPRSIDFKRRVNAIDLPFYEEVEFGKRQLGIDNNWLKEALDKIKREENEDRKIQLLKELKEGLITLESEMGNDAKEWVNPRHHLLKILKGMERQRRMRQLSASPSLLLLIILKWLKELLRRWGLLKIILYSLYLFILLIGVGIAVYILKKIEFKSAKRIEKETPVEFTKSSMDFAQFREIGKDYANKGDFRMAIRYLYLSLLFWLDRNGIITYDSTKTNGEYLRATKEKGRLHQYFHLLSCLFDEIWYGERPINLALYQEFFKNYTEAIEL